MTHVFQTDSELVNSYRSGEANYVVEIDPGSTNSDLCVVYFTSNAVYFPNTPDSFRRSIVEKDYYECRKKVPVSARKQIFFRDLHKQWYLPKGSIDLPAVATIP